MEHRLSSSPSTSASRRRVTVENVGESTQRIDVNALRTSRPPPIVVNPPIRSKLANPNARQATERFVQQPATATLPNSISSADFVQTQPILNPIEDDEIIPAPRFTTRAPKNLGDNPERLLLPSKCIFYDFDCIFIRVFSVSDLAALSKAIETKNRSLLYDIIDGTIDVDARSLWINDFRYIMYWHRLNSYTRLPYEVNWRSFYGTKHKLTVRKTDIINKVLEMSDEEYKTEWLPKGLTVPTVRDEEEYLSLVDKLDSEQKWLFERAQYVQGDSVLDKINWLNSHSNLSILEDIKDFITRLSKGGISETISTRVPPHEFDVEKALTVLRNQAKEIDDLMASDNYIPPAMLQILEDRHEKTSAEIARLAHDLETTGEAEPMLETIPLNIEVYDFFPAI